MNATADALDALGWARAELLSSTDSAARVIHRINHALCTARSALRADLWNDFIAQCRAHPVCALLHQDPLTRRSFTKPRGYPGDAGLLDIIYERDWRDVCPEDQSALGLEIFRHTIECQAPAAVRHRRELLAGMIDEMSERRPGATMLSVACGHLRELRLSAAMRQGRVGRFVGLDQDAASLAVAAQDWPHTLETVTGNIRALWGAGFRDQRFDFIYTAGLYDYLEEPLAQKLTARMFALLNPGGRLLVANYHPSVNDIGYMEAFMDWRLLYRDEAAMARLATGLPADELAKQRLFPDRTGAVVYLQLERRA